MPDMSVVLREAFPLGSLGPTVRRWWPLALTGTVAALIGWAAGDAWFGLKIGQAGVPTTFAGTGTAWSLPWGVVTTVLAVLAVVLVIVATVRPAFVLGRTVASALLGAAAVLSTAVWLAPPLMVTGDTDEMAAARAAGRTLTLVPQTGLVVTMVVTWVGASVLFMGRRNRPLGAS